MENRALREALIEAARGMNPANLNRGAAGNLSARCVEGGITGFLVTPTGMAYDTLQPADLAFVHQGSGESPTWSGPRKPSSEWRLHRDLYASVPEVQAVLHAHAPFATALACLRRDIPPFHYMVARFGGDSIRCADYALFGTQALSDAMLAAMRGRSACLLANHGLIVTADSVVTVLDRAIEFEALCEQYWRACQAGAPVLLSAAEMAEALVAFRDYGKQ